MNDTGGTPEAHPIVLFDGVCNFCDDTVQFVIKCDPFAVLRFAPLQSETGQRLLETHGLSKTDLDTMVLIDGDRCFTRSTAALEICSRLPEPWNSLRLFRIVPRFIRDVVYNLIARNRYRWFGKKETCMVPTPDIRRRFLQ